MLNAEVDAHGAWINRAATILDRGNDPSAGPNRSCQALCLHVAALYQAALLALKHDYPGPVYTLIRPTCETLLRAIWLHNDSAAESEFLAEKTPVISRLFPIIEAKMSGMPLLLSVLFGHLKRLHGLTHGGAEMLHIYAEGAKATKEESMKAVIADMRRLSATAMYLLGLITLARDDLAQLVVVLSEANL